MTRIGQIYTDFSCDRLTEVRKPPFRWPYCTTGKWKRVCAPDQSHFTTFHLLYPIPGPQSPIPAFPKIGTFLSLFLPDFARECEPQRHKATKNSQTIPALFFVPLGLGGWFVWF